MDELIISSTTSSINNHVESNYTGVEELTIEEFQLAQNGAIGLGAAGIGVIISLGIAAIIRFFYQV